MINQERVKQLYKIALYEQKEEKKHEAVGQLYKSDFIGKEVIKSIFCATIAYCLMVVVWVICNFETIVEMLMNLEILDMAKDIGMMYAVFLIVYVFITVLIYHTRYKKSREKLEQYMERLKIVDKMYERDEKLKM